jgi:hypothetical protein
MFLQIDNATNIHLTTKYIYHIYVHDVRIVHVGPKKMLGGKNKTNIQHKIISHSEPQFIFFARQTP